MLKYKKNVMELLKNAGYSSYFLEKNKIFGSKDLQKMRTESGMIGSKCLDRLCGLLHCQPGDLIEYIPDSDEEPRRHD